MPEMVLSDYHYIVTVIDETYEAVISSDIRFVVETTVVTGGHGTDLTAIHDNISREIENVPEKLSPEVADILLVEDSNEAYAKKRIQIGSLPGGSDIEDIRIGLMMGYNKAYEDHYSELSYTGDILTGVGIWQTAAKLLKLFTRTITYVGDNVDTVTLVDEIAGVTMMKTITYSGLNVDTVTIGIV